MNSICLFLDADGVLHSIWATNADGFEHATALGKLLARYPEVQVIVTSSWREVHRLDGLREFCGPVLGPRLVGTTPILKNASPLCRFLEISATWCGPASFMRTARTVRRTFDDHPYR